MSFLERFKRNTSETSSNSNHPEQEIQKRARRQSGFEAYTLASNADQGGLINEAHLLYQQAIQVYRSTEPDGVPFILGRFADFLERHGESNAARAAFEEAVRIGTDIPAIYSGLMRIYAASGNEDALFALAETWLDASPANNSAFQVLIETGRGLARESAFAMARRWLQRTEHLASARSASEARLLALVELGRSAEREGDLDYAITTYEQALAAGYRDRPGVTRLLMLYEKRKRWDELLALAESCRVGLKDVAWDADLLKRIARVRGNLKSMPAKHIRAADPSTVAVRHGQASFSIIGEVPVKYGARNLAYAPSGESLAVSAGTTKGPNLSLLAFDTASPQWTYQTPGSSADVNFLASGRVVAISGTGRIGSGSSEILIFETDGRLVARTSLSDRTSEVRTSNDLIYAGCRNGYMYCLNGDGEILWEFLVPQSAAVPYDGATFRPCPYFVQVPTAGDGVVFSSWNSLFRLGSDGALRWHWKADPKKTRWQTNAGFARPGHDARYLSALGLRSRPTDEELRRAFRQRALETHPDRNPLNPNANDEFRTVLEAYEALMGGLKSGIYPQGELNVFGAMAMSVFGLAISATGSDVLTSISDGSLILLNDHGKPQYRLVANEGAGHLVAGPDLQFSVYASWKGIDFYSGTGLISSYPSEELHRLRMSVDGNLVAAWRKKSLHLFDRTGRIIASVDFAQDVHDVQLGSQGEGAVSAGRVYGFRLKQEVLPLQQRSD